MFRPVKLFHLKVHLNARCQQKHPTLDLKKLAPGVYKCTCTTVLTSTFMRNHHILLKDGTKTFFYTLKSS